MRLKALALMLCLFVIQPSCSTVYMEEKTPAGQIPPGSESVPQQDTDRKGASGENTAETDEKGPSSKTSENENNEQRSVTEVFRDLYNKKGKPKFAVYLNDNLDEKKKKWISDSRWILKDQAKLDDSQQSRSSVIVTQNKQNRSGMNNRTNNRLRKWLWNFEVGFVNKLLRNGVSVKYRSTISRLADNDSSERNETLLNADREQAGFERLKEYADILVELSFVQNGQDDAEYFIKLTAEEIETGSLIAAETSRNMELDSQFEASSSGYEKKPPTVEELGTQLAQKFIHSLTKRWSADK